MLEVTVKTLDSQNHSFSVPDESTVKEFKDQIAPVLNIAADKQRLIFCGKVLKDDKKLTEYDVNGKVIHVVQSLPPQGNTTTSSSTSHLNSSGSTRNHRDAAGFLLGAFTIPQEMVDPSQVQNIVQDVVTGMGDIGRNATVMSRASDDGSVDVHINLGRVPVQVPLQSEAQLRMNRVQTMLIRANHLLESLEDGANSNNGNVADSSSQTETESNETRNSPIETEAGNSSTTDEVPNSSDTSSSSEESTLSGEAHINADITSEINLGDVSISSNEPERFRFEGLAHAAQAAISAAFATAAAAAARAAATTMPVIPSPGQTSEPMDIASSALPVDFVNPGGIRPDDPTVIAMDSLPSDTEPATTEPTPAEGETPSADSESHHPDCPLSSTRPPTANGSTPSSRRPVLVQPSVQTLANLLDEVIRVNTRLQPCLERCRDLIRNDSTLTGRALGDAHRLFSRVSQLMHFLSHAYHSLSDLHINFTQPPPRSPRVRIISSTHSASLFQGIPMQAQISISTSNGVLPNPSQSTTTTANTSNNDSTRNSTADARPVPAPRVSQASTGIIGSSSGSGNPLSFVTSTQSPVVFMEVTPGSVTLDSIDSISSLATPVSTSSSSTTVFNVVPVPPPAETSQSGGFQASSTNTTTTAPSTTSNAENPPSTPSQTEANTDTQSSTSRSSAPNATPLSNGQGPQPLNIPFRNLIPVPLTSMGSLHTFDSGLPCHSVWALEPSRRRHNAGGSRTSTATAGMTPNAPGRQEDQLQQVISNIMMSLLNHTPTPSNPVPAGFTVIPNRGDDGSRESLIFVNAMGQGSRDRPSSSENNEVPSSSTAHARSSSSVATAYQKHVRWFTDLDMIRKKLAEGLPNLAFDTDSICGSIMNFLINTLTFKDIIDVSCGKFDSFNKYREVFSEYIREKIFHSEQIEELQYETVVNQISEEIETTMQSYMSTVAILQGMDYKAALASFFRQNVRKLIDTVLGKPESTSLPFGVHLVTTLHLIFREFLYINDLFTVNGTDLLRHMAMVAVESATVDISYPHQLAVRTLLMSALAKAMQYSIPRTSRASSTSNTKKPTAPGLSRSSQRTTPNDSNKKAAPAKSSTSETSRPNRATHGIRRANFVEALGVNEALSGGLSGNRAAPTLAAFARIAEQTTALLRNNARQNDSPPVRGLTEVVIGSDAWHSSVPRDWVPIIARDVQRQRRQAPQAPFSNAYLSGMPSKRRKIMTNGSPTLLEPSPSALSDMLLQAISSANVKPKTNIEEVKKDAAQDAPLQASFNEHMKQAIRERLNCDVDYCSERFPNSEKYFN